MLERIRIQRFKSLVDVELRLAPLVVVLGPNAVGKSNLLEAVMLLGRLVTERTVGDALAPPIRGYPLEAFGLPVGGLREMLAACIFGLSVGTPDLLVVVIDGNCTTSQAKRKEIEAILDTTVFSRSVIGCPDPHVERWCFADPNAFQAVVGVPPPPDPDKCERDLYKQLLNEALANAATPVLTNEMEVAPDIVAAADLYKSLTAQPSLGGFVDDLRAELTLLRGSSKKDTLGP